MRPNVSELIFLLVAFVETIFSWGCSYDNLSNEIWILLLWYNTAPSTPPARLLYLKFIFSQRPVAISEHPYIQICLCCYFFTVDEREEGEKWDQ